MIREKADIKWTISIILRYLDMFTIVVFQVTIINKCFTTIITFNYGRSTNVLRRRGKGPPPPLVVFLVERVEAVRCGNCVIISWVLVGPCVSYILITQIVCVLCRAEIFIFPTGALHRTRVQSFRPFTLTPACWLTHKVILISCVNIIILNPISYGGGWIPPPQPEIARYTRIGRSDGPKFFWLLVFSNFTTFGEKKIWKKMGGPPLRPP